jgi:hypothetical protein
MPFIIFILIKEYFIQALLSQKRVDSIRAFYCSISWYWLPQNEHTQTISCFLPVWAIELLLMHFLCYALSNISIPFPLLINWIQSELFSSDISCCCSQWLFPLEPHPSCYWNSQKRKYNKLNFFSFLNGNLVKNTYFLFIQGHNEVRFSGNIH